MTVKINNIDLSEYITECDLRHSCRVKALRIV